MLREFEANRIHPQRHPPVKRKREIDFNYRIFQDI